LPIANTYLTGTICKNRTLPRLISEANPGANQTDAVEDINGDAFPHWFWFAVIVVNSRHHIIHINSHNKLISCSYRRFFTVFSRSGCLLCCALKERQNRKTVRFVSKYMNAVHNQNEKPSKIRDVKKLSQKMWCHFPSKSDSLNNFITTWVPCISPFGTGSYRLPLYGKKWMI
jgi:hypothetical protein